MHAGVVSRNIQQQRVRYVSFFFLKWVNIILFTCLQIKQGSVSAGNGPPGSGGHPYGKGVPGIAGYKHGSKPPTSRGHVKHIKVKGKKKGKKGARETYDLIVNIDLVRSVWIALQLNASQTSLKMHRPFEYTV